MAKFTIEDILEEYSPDGKRSKIQQDADQPLAHGTLETEKLLSAATSDRPLPDIQSGYHHVTKKAESQEELVDIKSTISNIKAKKDAQTALNLGGSPLIREHFPTQELKREAVSYIKSGRGSYEDQKISSESYDSAVKLTPTNLEVTETMNNHKPQIREMQDSTRAKEKRRKRKHRRSVVESNYEENSIIGVIPKPKPKLTEEKNSSKKKMDVLQEELPGEEDKPTSLRSMRQKSYRQMGESNHTPDNMEQVWNTLCNLRNVIFVRCIILLLLTLVSAGLEISLQAENYVLHAWTESLTARAIAGIEVGLAAIGIGVSFPTIKKGLLHIFQLHADSDSMAAIPMVIATIGALLVLIRSDALAHEMVHLYVPCALLAMFCNAIGRLFVVRRALRNCRVLSKETQKRVLSYVSQEEMAELLTRGIIHDVPIVAAVRKADALCDFLRYTYSCDMADTMCCTMTPISFIVSLVLSLFLTFVRLGTNFSLTWFCVLFSMLSLFLTACCCLASALISNLPLEWESKRASNSGSALLGYQSADDFFDVNALLVDAGELFPTGSVQIAGLKMFTGAKVDEVLLDAASLAHHAGSILKGAFEDMIPDHEVLRSVDQFVCEDGLGLCGWIANRRVLFGGREMMVSHNIEGLPAKPREAKIAETEGEIVYLSVSGVLSAMFTVRITADAAIQRKMRVLKQENISLVIRCVDHCVTLHRINQLLQYPENLMKILPASMHHLFQHETSDLGCISASMTVGNEGFGAAQLLLGAKRVRRASVIGVIMQVISALLGLVLATIHIFTGAYETMTAQFFLVYHLVLTLITIMAVKIRN